MKDIRIDKIKRAVLLSKNKFLLLTEEGIIKISIDSSGKIAAGENIISPVQLGNTEDVLTIYLHDRKWIYAAGSRIIRIFDLTGQETGIWQPIDTDNQDLSDIRYDYVLFDQTGRLYFVDNWNRTVMFYTIDGRYQGKIDAVKDLRDRITEASAVRRMKNGDILIADRLGCRLLLFDSQGLSKGAVPRSFNFPYGLEYHGDSGTIFVFEYPDDFIDSPVITILDADYKKIAYIPLWKPRPLVKMPGRNYGVKLHVPGSKIGQAPQSPKPIISFGMNKEGLSLYHTGSGYAETIPAAPPELFKAKRVRITRSQKMECGNNKSYPITLGGALDAFNTKSRGRVCRYKFAAPPGFQPGESLSIENKGNTVIHNPRVIEKNGVHWQNLESILRSLTLPEMTEKETALALWMFVRETFRFGIAQNNFYPAVNSSAIKHFTNSGTGHCGTHIYVKNLFQKAGIPAQQGVYRCPGLAHVLVRFFFDGKWNYMDFTNPGCPYEYNLRSMIKGYRGAYFLMLDNETLASTDDLMEDPYIEYRLYGGSHAWDQMLYRVRPLTIPVLWENTAESDYQDPENMNFNLRPGEKITYRWDFLGKHYGSRKPIDCIVNGEIDYSPPANPEWAQKSILKIHNLTVQPDKALLKYDPSSPKGYAVFEIESPYGIVGSYVQANVRSTAKEQAQITVAYSLDGNDWKYNSTGEIPAAFAESAGETASIFSAYEPFFNRSDDSVYPVYRYYLKIEVNTEDKSIKHSGFILLENIIIKTEFQANEVALPALRCGKNEFLYQDDTQKEHTAEITYTWKESSFSSPPPAPAEAVFPRDNETVTGADFKFVWKNSTLSGGNAQILDYEFFLSDREDMLYPVSTCFNTFTNSGTAELPNPNQTCFSPGKKYFWKVRAMNKDGVWGPWSKTWRFPYNGPGQVKSAELKKDGRKIILQWEAPGEGTPVSHYLIYSSRERGFIPADRTFKIHNGKRKTDYPVTFFSRTAKTSFTVVDENLTDPRANNLFYRIIAVDKDGNRGTPSTNVYTGEPFIYSNPPEAGRAGQPYAYGIKCLYSGPEIIYEGETAQAVSAFHSSRLEYELVHGPGWITIDRQKGMLTGVPPHAGEERISIKVSAYRMSDGELLGTDLQEFRVTIKA